MSTEKPPVEIAPATLADHVVGLAPHFTRLVLAAIRAQPHGARLTPPQFRLLNVVRLSPGLSLVQVATLLGVTKPTASVLVLRTASQGLLIASTGHGRRLALTLTADGERLVAAVTTRAARALSDALSRQAEEDRAAIAAAIMPLQHLLTAASAGID